MVPVIKHPKLADFAGAQVRRLKSTLESERQRAVATLSSAVVNLRRLAALCDAPELRTLTTEYAIYLSALKNIDPASGEDGLRDQMHLIERRLIEGLQTLQHYSAPAPTKAD